jgi:Dopey, N-terminal
MYIFGLIGEDGLVEDLAVYLPGVASTLTFASISVRSLFLSLIENHVLKIQTSALRPALKALILALLPGLEEETSDEFETTLRILNQTKHQFSSAGLAEVFWQNLFLASITSSSRRQGVLAYLTRYLPSLGRAVPDSPGTTEDRDRGAADVSALTTPEPGLLLRCFSTGLADEQMLVQRAFLDLLVSHLPLHAPLFHQQILAEDLQLLISAAIGVVLRRDMSLNRRLWSWFLGPDLVPNPKSESGFPTSGQADSFDNHNAAKYSDTQSYFQIYAVKPLIRSLETMIGHDYRVPSKVARPFRIALSLMDRWEIGGPVVDAIFLPLVRSLRSYQQNAACKDDFDEVFRSANVFFDGVESRLIWSKMLSLALLARKAKDDILDDLDLATFIIAHFNVREEEMVTLYIPLVSLAFLEDLTRADTSHADRRSPLNDPEVQSSAFHVLGLMIDMIPDYTFVPRSDVVSTFEWSVAKVDETSGIQEAIKPFLDNSEDAVEISGPPFSPKSLGKYFLLLLAPMISKKLHNDMDGFGLSRCVQVLSLLLEKLPSYEGLDATLLVAALTQRLAVQRGSPRELPFLLISSATALFLSFIHGESKNEIVNFDDVRVIIPLLVRHLWSYLSSKSPQYHVETVHLLEDIQYLVSQEELVTSTISSLVVGSDIERATTYLPSKDNLDRFTILWTHSRSKSITDSKTKTETLALVNERQREAAAAFSSMLSSSMISVLSVLRVPQTEVCASCRDWLQGLSDLSR